MFTIPKGTEAIALNLSNVENNKISATVIHTTRDLAFATPVVISKSLEKLILKAPIIDTLREVIQIDEIGHGGLISHYEGLFFQDLVNPNWLIGVSNSSFSVSVDVPKVSLKGKYVVFTGTLQSMKRSAAQDRVLLAGGRVSNTINSRVGIVVAGDKPGTKIKQAQQYGCKIISEKEFLVLLGE